MGKQWKQWQTLFLWAPKSLQMMTAAMKLKDTPWKESYGQPRQHIKKQRHYFSDKGPSSQGYHVWMYGCNHVWMWELDYKESWVPKNWCFWTVVLEKTLASSLDCKEFQPVHHKEISPEYSLEGLILKLKLQYFGQLMERADSFEKTLMLGKIKGRMGRGRQRMRCWMASLTRWTWVWVNSGSWWGTGRPVVLQSMGSQRVRHDWVTELNWVRTYYIAQETLSNILDWPFKWEGNPKNRMYICMYLRMYVYIYA